MGNKRDEEITHREIKIISQILPEQPSLQHFQNYSGLDLIIKITLKQDFELATHFFKFPPNAKVYVRLARPADRPMITDAWRYVVFDGASRN